MNLKRIMLDEQKDDVYLDAYLADRLAGLCRKALIVIPGGGYSGVCADREGEPIAQAFIPYGYQAFVLHYTVDQKHPFPTQLIETAKAIKHVKDHAEEYGIDREQVFVVGFSAGGHLAACAGILWKLPEIRAAVSMPEGYNKPTGVMLIYPVVSPEHHGFSFNHLLCKENPTEEELSAVAVERHVDKDSSPAFLLHTANDQVVNVKNALCLANAYADQAVPFEMHVYPNGPHGMALANHITDGGTGNWFDPAIAEWVRMAAYWADHLPRKEQ